MCVTWIGTPSASKGTAIACFASLTGLLALHSYLRIIAWAEWCLPPCSEQLIWRSRLAGQDLVWLPMFCTHVVKVVATDLYAQPLTLSAEFWAARVYSCNSLCNNAHESAVHIQAHGSLLASVKMCQKHISNVTCCACNSAWLAGFGLQALHASSECTIIAHATFKLELCQVWLENEDVDAYWRLIAVPLIIHGLCFRQSLLSWHWYGHIVATWLQHTNGRVLGRASSSAASG